MLAHDAVQRNLQTLAARGVRFVEPGEGYLACGWIGKGRLAEPPEIVAAAVGDARRRSSRRFAVGASLVTAGPTYEDIDPVRYLGNRSSGRMGFALAAEAQRRGARVTLVAGPTRIDPPAVDELVRVRSAAEMHAAVMRDATRADVVDHGGRRGRLHAGGAAAAEGGEAGRTDDADARADARHPGRARTPAVAVRDRRPDAGRLCGRDRRCGGQGARQAGFARGSI